MKLNSSTEPHITSSFGAWIFCIAVVAIIFGGASYAGYNIGKTAPDASPEQNIPQTIERDARQITEEELIVRWGECMKQASITSEKLINSVCENGFGQPRGENCSLPTALWPALTDARIAFEVSCNKMRGL